MNAMKQFYFLWLLMVGMGWMAKGQGNASSSVSLALVNGQQPIVAVGTDGYFSLNASTGEFKAVINLFPIVPSPDRYDSMAYMQRPLQLTMRGSFPAGDISFLTSKDNDRTYSMPCSCSIYDSVKSCTVQFHLVTNQDQPLTVQIGANVYQSTMNFVMVIDPHDFGLARQPFAIPQPILVIARDAVLNKGR